MGALSTIKDLLLESHNLRDTLMYESSMMTNNLLILALSLQVAELVDMLIFSKITLLTIHHMVFITCSVGALFFERAIGFGVLSLVNLLNTVSIKTRFIHVLSSTDSKSTVYKINSYFNIITFFIRMIIIIWVNLQLFIFSPEIFRS